MKLPSMLAVAIVSLGLPGAAVAQPAPAAPKPVSPGRVACVGDSITQGSGTQGDMNYPKQLGNLLGRGWTVGNFGVSGRTLLRKGDHPYWDEPAFAQARAFAPNAVVIMLGTNDTKPQNWAKNRDFETDYTDLVKTFQNLPGKPRVYICLPPPIIEPNKFNILKRNLQREIPVIKQVARKTNADLIDNYSALKPHPGMLPDGVHPDNDGARILAETVYSALTGTPAPDPAPTANQ
jgi:acyl-CoA thioesterase I